MERHATRQKTLGELPGALSGSAAEVQKEAESINPRGGYHGSNNLREMDGMHDALINLATADAADRETMMS